MRAILSLSLSLAAAAAPQDPERAAIYERAGFEGLAASEAFQAASALEVGPFARFDKFFEGEDPGDRE